MRRFLVLTVLGAGCSHEEPVFTGRLSIEGDEAWSGRPDVPRHVYPHDCLSGEPVEVFGVDLFTTRGDLRFVHYPDDGPVMSFSPEDDELSPWEVRPEVCDVFRGELKRTETKVEGISVMRGRLELDCMPYGHGLRVYGDVTFDGCAGERKY